MNFTVIDGGVVALMLISGILAYSRGLTRELFAIGAWVASAVAAFYLAPQLEPLLREIPAVGPRLAESCVISVTVAFALIMAVGLLILAVFTPLISGAILDSAFGPIDRILGFLFGVARGALLAAIAWLVYTEAILGTDADGNRLAEAASVETAVTRDLFVGPAEWLKGSLFPEAQPGEETPTTALMDWFEARTNALLGTCEGGAPTPAPANDGGGSGAGGGSVVAPPPPPPAGT